MEEPKLIPVKDFKEGEELSSRIDEEGNIKFVKKSEQKRGKKSRASGARFELKVRNDLEEKGWITDKWTNNFDLEQGLLVKAKRKYNPFKGVLGIGTGFPDFIIFRLIDNKKYNIIGVEVKSNGYLNRDEKEKCAVLLSQKVFSEIWIAKKSKERGKIEYDDFKERYKKLFD